MFKTKIVITSLSLLTGVKLVGCSLQGNFVSHLINEYDSKFRSKTQNSTSCIKMDDVMVPQK